MDREQFIYFYKLYISGRCTLQDRINFTKLYLLNKDINIIRVSKFIAALHIYNWLDLFVLYITTLESQKHSLIIIRDINNNIIKIY